MSAPPIRERDLDELIARLAGGDRSAFDPLYAALRPRALRLARARLGDDRAVDVAQAALLDVFSRASEFTPGRACLPWFYGIVGNQIQASRRRDHRLVLAAEAPLDLPSDRPDAETQLVDQELHRALEVAVDALDEEGASAIRAMLGRAPLPNLSPATFRKRVSRAYARLRLLLGGDHG